MKATLASSVSPLRAKLYLPTHLRVVFKDIFNIYPKGSRDENLNHLRCVIDWLKYAQDINQDGGVSAGYSFRYGWRPSYPETTGYIIPTFLDYYHLTEKKEYLNRAIGMADWLVSIQFRDGSVRGLFGDAPARPTVFNTGQVLQGLTRMYKETRQTIYLEAASKAAGWLVEIQDEDGAWRRFTYNGVTHSYHTRVAWPLLELYKLTSDESYLRAATKNIEWALSNQEANGWFPNNAFTPKDYPFLHTIAYAIEGLLESAAIMNNQTWLEASVKPAEVLRQIFEAKGNLAGIYDDEWKGIVNYRCLTGEAQISVCWLRFFQLSGDRRYLSAALKINDILKRLQDTSSPNRGLNGGVKGSHPIWGAYSPFSYPNWAAKFLANALMLEERWGG
jgi:uncharacterized protein YyaL (SSP411 family)